MGSDWTISCGGCHKMIIAESPEKLPPPWRRFSYESKKHKLNFRPEHNACSDECELAYRAEWAKEE